MASSHSQTLFGKHYRGRYRAARAEWHWLHFLPLLGIEAPQPVAWLAEGQRSLVVTAGLPGRSLDSWLRDAEAEGWLESAFRYVCSEVSGLARRLHHQGLIHRDLNCAHIFGADPRLAGAPALIDVERMMRPKLRWQRWVVKELASLLASSPVVVPTSVQWRFLRRYAPGTSGEGLRFLARKIVRKAGRIRAHQPKFG
jgi:hypothetical protein